MRVLRVPTDRMQHIGDGHELSSCAQYPSFPGSLVSGELQGAVANPTARNPGFREAGDALCCIDRSRAVQRCDHLGLRLWQQ